MKTNSRTRNPLSVVSLALDDGTIEAWARAGATDRQIAHYLGIGKDSFIKAKKELTDLSDRLQRARRPLVPEAFYSLVRLANGYEYTETVEEEREAIHHGEIVKLKTVTTYHKHMAPNLNAISRVILNYQKKERDDSNGIPTEYITTPPETDTANRKEGRLPELDKALYGLFFGPTENRLEEGA